MAIAQLRNVLLSPFALITPSSALQAATWSISLSYKKERGSKLATSRSILTLLSHSPPRHAVAVMDPPVTSGLTRSRDHTACP